ncbi:MAG: iron-sulfur cluster assembly accessory protein [Candidatus Woesearchaeota archaeon]
MQKTEQLVTKDMVIADVLKKYPDVAVIMLEHGLHCVGCHANVFDTIEAGCKVHGLDDATVDSLVAEINRFVSAEAHAPKEEPQGPAKLFISELAASKVKELQKKGRMESFGLRVSVMPGGCSGFVYQMNFEKGPEKTDVVLEDRGVKLFIDPDSLNMLRGAEIDYVDSLNESGFKIKNPNAKQSCGCGKSFG